MESKSFFWGECEFISSSPQASLPLQNWREKRKKMKPPSEGGGWEGKRGVKFFLMNFNCEEEKAAYFLKFVLAFEGYDSPTQKNLGKFGQQYIDKANICKTS